jgi:hypothetical protein
MATNMFTEMRIISVFAMISSIFFLLGAGVIMVYTVQQPSQWSQLPGYTNFTDTVPNFQSLNKHMNMNSDNFYWDVNVRI